MIYFLSDSAEINIIMELLMLWQIPSAGASVDAFQAVPSVCRGQGLALLCEWLQLPALAEKRSGEFIRRWFLLGKEDI